MLHSHTSMTRKHTSMLSIIESEVISQEEEEEEMQEKSPQNVQICNKMFIEEVVSGHPVHGFYVHKKERAVTGGENVTICTHPEKKKLSKGRDKADEKQEKRKRGEVVAERSRAAAHLTRWVPVCFARAADAPRSGATEMPAATKYRTDKEAKPVARRFSYMCTHSEM